MKTKQIRNIEIIKWIGTSFGIIGALTMAVFGFTYAHHQIWMFGAYTIGTVMWIIAGYIERDNPLIVMNVVFFLINVIAIITRI